MKNILLSADGDIKVPDIVADNLKHYCLRFIDWVHKNPDKFLLEKQKVFYFDETGFIEYLNSRFFPKEPSFYVKQPTLQKSPIMNGLKNIRKCHGLISDI